MKAEICTKCGDYRWIKGSPLDKSTFHTHDTAKTELDPQEKVVSLTNSQRDWLYDAYVLGGGSDVDGFDKPAKDDLRNGRELRVVSLHPLWWFCVGVIDRSLHGDKDALARKERGYAKRIIGRIQRQYLQTLKE